MIRIFGGPTRYVQGPGAIARLGELTERLTQRPLLVVDADVLPFVEASLAASFGSRPHTILAFRGEVTQNAIGALVAQASASDCVIGIGGGKGLDAAKGVAFRLELPFIAVPSIASNDSPTGRSMAIYNDEHVLVAIESIPDSPLLVVADTALIANAPARFLRTGMGDALAKKFEAERAFADGASNFFGTRPLRIALAIADACYATLREHGVAAMAAAERHVPDEAFEAVVEANVLMAGLAWESGGLSYAHAVVRGLVKARGAAAAPHGDHVAYGTLVQFAIEGRDDAFIRDVIGFNNSVGLPASLAELGMEAPVADEISEIARLTAIGPKGGRIIVAASAEEIAAAIKRIEALA
ncbi:MAG: iron-containing alcohol dehydrogenase [Sphingomonadales bacterium]|nr:MAG: iron-containing alcohol dehydrogenase [Sphingomonadales bacterium]